MGDGIKIPGKFWRTLTPEEFKAIVLRGGLNEMQCIRLWKMLGRSERCPTSLTVFVNRADVTQQFPPQS